MEFDEVVLGRRSIRGYKQEPVPREVIEEVLELAVRAPSSMNTQPWHLYVVTGEVLDKIRKGNTERNVSGVPPSREIKTPNRGYDNPKLSELSETALKEILKNEESFYKRNSKE